MCMRMLEMGLLCWLVYWGLNTYYLREVLLVGLHQCRLSSLYPSVLLYIKVYCGVPLLSLLISSIAPVSLLISARE